MQSNTVARRLVETLLAHGVDHVFCVPGESYLAVLDALVDVADRIRVITCRHEGAAANMADAYAKLTGRTGVCMVTRGPGATHAAIGIHTAHQDSSPVVMFVGQVAFSDKGRGAFQELDYPQAFGAIAKWAVELDDANRVDEIVGRAFAVADQGRKGPVVVALPEDVLSQAAPDAAAPIAPKAARAGLDPAILTEIGTRLAAAERPLLLLGGSGWSQEALEALTAWSGRLSLPIVLSFRRKDLIDNAHPAYVGDLGLGSNPKLVARMKAADLIIAIGARLGETPSQGYTLFTRDETLQRLIHIHAGAEELNRVWPAAIAAVADPVPAALALSTLEPGRTWEDWRAEARTEWQAFTTPIPGPAAVNLSEVAAHMAEVLPHDAIITNGAGNFSAWLRRFYPQRGYVTQLAPTSGAMGYGVPAAIAAKLVRPEREVVCFAGDGDFLMTGQELATAAQYGANVIIIVADNGSYGTIRMHQERDYPNRVMATDLKNPDFAALAESFGAFAVKVDATADFPAAFAAARAAGRPALIHLKCDVEAIAPGVTLTSLRAGR
jgi:acetolactate synthase-1/2/3 large subunit